jgi:hypothetical protein
MTSKPWYHSKVIWLNVFTVVVAIITLASQSPLFEPYLQWLLFGQGIANIFLRVITATAIEGGEKWTPSR